MQAHIEFAGTPGVGKSTLCDELVEYMNNMGKSYYTLHHAERVADLRSIGFPKPTTIQKLLPGRLLDHMVGNFPSLSQRSIDRYQLFFCTYPELGRIIPKAIDEKLNSTEDKVIYSRWFFQLISAFQAANKWLDQTEVLVVDEGFANRTITLFCGRDNIEKEWNERIIEYLSQVPNPDVLIIPGAPVETCERRIRSGNRSFPYKVDGSDQASVRQFLTEREECISITKQYFESTSTKVITVDNSGKLSQTVHSLQSEIREIH